MLNAWQLVEHSIHDVFDADRTRAIFLIGAGSRRFVNPLSEGCLSKLVQKIMQLRVRTQHLYRRRR